jgi:hypothetical protein
MPLPDNRYETYSGRFSGELVALVDLALCHVYAFRVTLKTTTGTVVDHFLVPQLEFK